MGIQKLRDLKGVLILASLAFLAGLPAGADTPEALQEKVTEQLHKAGI